MLAMAEKRDTTLKYLEDDVDPKNPVFVNMTQLRGATPLKKNDIEDMYSTIENWLQENEPDITGMKSNAEKAALDPLVTVLYNKFDDMFMDVERSFIRAVMTFVIQRKLLNLRRATDESKGNQQEFAPPTPSTPGKAKAKEPSAAPTSKPVPVAVHIEDFGIRARAVQDSSTAHSSQAPRLSVVTLEDVIPDSIVDNKSLISWASFQLWADILRQDISYTEFHTITYMFAEGLLTIKRDRQFRAALVDAPNSGLSYAMFDVTIPLQAGAYTSFI